LKVLTSPVMLKVYGSVVEQMDYSENVRSYLPQRFVKNKRQIFLFYSLLLLKFPEGNKRLQNGHKDFHWLLLVGKTLEH